MTDRFAVLLFYQFIQPDGYILQFHTNRECRLTLRHSAVEPVVHREPALRRGLLMHTDPRFCFVAWTEIEQQEDGDTIIHSFYYRPDPLPFEVWFYLVGTINGADAPSTSPLMHLPLNLIDPTETKYQETDLGTHQWCSWNKPYAMGFKCPSDPELSGLQLPISGLNQPAWVTFRLMDTEPEYHRPRNILRETIFYLMPEKRNAPNSGYLYFPIEPITLTPGDYYAIGLFGDRNKPDTETITWKWGNTNPLDPTEYWFRGTKLNGDYSWQIFTTRYFGYRSWKNIPFYLPGVPTSYQMPG